MAHDMEIIKQIEKQLGIELKPVPLKKLMSVVNSFSVDNMGQVKGLRLDGRNIKDISFIRSLGGLTHLSLNDNQIRDITPLSTLTNMKKLRLSNNQIEDITPLSALTQ
jgi:internalin A